MTTFKCNNCGNEFDLLDRKCQCGGRYVLPKAEVEQRADNTGSPKLPAEIVDLLKRGRTAITPYYQDTLLIEDLNDIIGG